MSKNTTMNTTTVTSTLRPETHQLVVPYKAQNNEERRQLHRLIEQMDTHVMLTPNKHRMIIEWLDSDMTETNRQNFVDDILRPYSEFIQTQYKHARIEHNIRGVHAGTLKKECDFAVFANGFITCRTSNYHTLHPTHETRIIQPGESFYVYFSEKHPRVIVTPTEPTNEATHDDATVVVRFIDKQIQKDLSQPTESTLVLDALHWC